MTDQVQKLAEEMDKSIEQMEQNNLLSEQIMKKMMELQTKTKIKSFQKLGEELQQ